MSRQQMCIPVPIGFSWGCFVHLGTRRWTKAVAAALESSGRGRGTRTRAQTRKHWNRDRVPGPDLLVLVEEMMPALASFPGPFRLGARHFSGWLLAQGFLTDLEFFHRN
eukprot:1396563-Rhodomonas_salina.1